MTKCIAFIAGILLFAGGAIAQDLKSRLSVASSLHPIREFCARFAQLGEIHEGEYRSTNVHFFACWVQPKAASVPAFLFGYLERDGRWHLAVDHPETSAYAGAKIVISILDETVLLLNSQGQVIHAYALGVSIASK